MAGDKPAAEGPELEFVAPERGATWEQGREVTVRLRARGVEAVTVVLSDARHWTSWGAATLADKAPVAADGSVAITWTVPAALPPSVTYALHAKAAPLRVAEAALAGLKVVPPLCVARVGEAVLDVRWSAGAVPALPPGASAARWELAVDVAPVLDESRERAADVLGELFVAAALSGERVHTKRADAAGQHRLLFAVSEEDARRRAKRLRLLPNRAYRVALAGFGDGDVDTAWATCRVECSLSFSQLELAGAGTSTGPATRSCKLADGFYRRAGQQGFVDAPEPAAPAPQDQDPGAEESPAAPVKAWEWAAVSGGVPSDGWAQERGVNVLVLRLSDMEAVYDRTFDTLGHKRAAASMAAVAELREAVAKGGELDVEALRWHHGEMLVLVSTCVGWEASKETGVGAALSALLGAAGVPADSCAAVQALAERAQAGKGPSTPFAAVAVAGRGGWVAESPSAKQQANVRMMLASEGDVDARWYPSFVQTQGGPWRVCWSDWGGEPWGLADDNDDARSRRVERYGVVFEQLDGLLEEGPDRVELTGALASLVSNATELCNAIGWGSSHLRGPPQSPRVALVQRLEKLLQAVVPPLGASGEGNLRVACETVAAGTVEYLSTRIEGLLAAAPPPSPDCGAEGEGVPEQDEERDEARALLELLCRILLAGNARLVAEGVRRGALEALLVGFEAFWPGTGVEGLADVVHELVELDTVVCDVLAAATSVEGDDSQPPTPAAGRLGCTALRTGLTCTASPAPLSGPMQVIELSACKPMEELRLTSPVVPLPPTPGDTEEQCPEPEATLDGKVVVVRAKGGHEAAFRSIVAQAPRLVWLAEHSGAVAVIFECPPMHGARCVRALLPNPNCMTASGIPSYVVAAGALESVAASDDVVGVVEVRCEAHVRDSILSRCVPRMTEYVKRGIDDDRQSMDALEPEVRYESVVARSARSVAAATTAAVTSGTTAVVGIASVSAAPLRATLELWQNFRGRSSSTASEQPQGETDGAADGGDADMSTEADGTATEPEGEQATSVEVDGPAPEVVPMDTEGSDPPAGAVIEQPEDEQAQQQDAPSWHSTWSDAARTLVTLGRPLPYPQRRRAVHILCCDGGGVRGLASVTVLKHVVEAVEREVGRKVSVSELFDLAAGTSTGGIISVASALGYSCDEVGDIYKECSREIFGSDSYTSLLRNGPGYLSTRRFEGVLRRYVGEAADKPLSATAWDASVRRPGAPRPYLALVSTLTSRDPATTMVMRNYTHAKADGRRDEPPVSGTHRASLLQSVRATSAAPWYMEELIVDWDACRGAPTPATGKGAEDGSGVAAALRLIDGGIASNNPTDVAISEARRVFGRDRPLVVLSIGTGAGLPRELIPSTRYPAWLQSTIAATGDVAQKDATVRSLLRESDTYVRLQPTGEAFSVAMDDSRDESMLSLERGATAFMRSEAAARSLAQVAKALAAGLQ